MPATSLQSMLDKIIIIDFEDSFTYNIASVLFPLNPSVKVISHQEFFNSKMREFLESKEKHALILGPGPGHPDAYQKYFKQIETFRNLPQFYVMGICLGHQMLGLMDGKVVGLAQEQIHGQTIFIEFDGVERPVQRYNSLAVYENGSEVNIRRFDRGISYQFHPESVGTDSNPLYFKELLNFLKS
jgi:anthranilate/para-aminobenzoate synthase component II